MNKILITFLLLVSQLVYSQTTPPLKKVLAAGSDGNALPINNLSGLSIGSNAATANIPLWISKDQTGTVSNRIANIHTGTSSLVEFYLENSSSNIKLRKLSTGFTTSGILVANAGVLDNSAGDLIIKNSSGSPIIFGGSTTEWGRFDGTTFSTPAATHSTSTTSPLIIGGSGTTQTLTYKTTTGVGATGADHIFQVGNNGGTEAMRIINSGSIGVGISPTAKFHLNTTAGLNGGMLLSLGANHGTASSSYSSIDFTVPTTGLIGQFLASGSNYSSASVNLAANSIFLAAEATSGQLALMAGGTSGYMTFNTGGFTAATERARILSSGEILIGKTTASYGELFGIKKDQTTQTTFVIENANASGIVNVKVIGNQKQVGFGVYNSTATPYGAVAANDCYMYGSGNFTFMTEGATNVMKWSTGSSTLEKMRLDADGDLGINNTAPSAKIHASGTGTTSATYVMKLEDSANDTLLYVRDDGALYFGDNGTNTTAGDAATINQPTGSFIKDNSGTTFTLTNSLITAKSKVLCQMASDLTATGHATSVAVTAGSAVITFWTLGGGATAAAPSGNQTVNFWVVNY